VASAFGATPCRRISKSPSNKANALFRLPVARLASSVPIASVNLSKTFNELCAPAQPRKRLSTPNKLSLERPGGEIAAHFTLGFNGAEGSALILVRRPAGSFQGEVDNSLRGVTL
jgi:hypothetical protein